MRPPEPSDKHRSRAALARHRRSRPAIADNGQRCFRYTAIVPIVRSHGSPDRDKTRAGTTRYVTIIIRNNTELPCVAPPAFETADNPIAHGVLATARVRKPITPHCPNARRAAPPDRAISFRECVSETRNEFAHYHSNILSERTPYTCVYALDVIVDVDAAAAHRQRSGSTTGRPKLQKINTTFFSRKPGLVDDGHSQSAVLLEAVFVDFKVKNRLEI